MAAVVRFAHYLFTGRRIIQITETQKRGRVRYTLDSPINIEQLNSV